MKILVLDNYDPENEVQEVYNKLAALENAMEMAQLNSKPR